MANNLITCHNAGFQSLPSTWRAEPHSHSFTEMVFVVDGEVRTWVGGEERKAHAGHVLLYPPLIPHREFGHGTRRVELLHLGIQGPVPKEPNILLDREGRLNLMAKWILDVSGCMYQKKQEVMDALTTALIVQFTMLASYVPSRFLESLQTLFRRNLGNPLTVQEMAEHACLSREGFLRTYKRLTGITPMAHLRRFRVEAARDLLITTNMPIKAIAQKVGFCDQFHLSRVFRKILGVSPSFFRHHHSPEDLQARTLQKLTEPRR